MIYRDHTPVSDWVLAGLVVVGLLFAGLAVWVVTSPLPEYVR